MASEAPLMSEQHGQDGAEVQNVTLKASTSDQRTNDPEDHTRLLTGEAHFVPGLGNSFRDMAGQLPLQSPRGIVICAGVAIAVLGQVFIWIKNGALGTNSPITAKDSCQDEKQQGTRDQLGVFALLLVVIAFANFHAFRSAAPHYTWISAAVAFSIMDINICETHWLVKCTPGPDTSTSDANLLKAGYVMLLIGCIVTFAAFPVSSSVLGGGGGVQRTGRQKIERIAGFVLVVLLLIGSILLWSKRSPCKSDRGAGGVKFPIYVGRAAYLALWHAMSLIADYRDGLELSFIYATVSIADYQPWGPRCDWGECQAGTVIIFISLIIMVIIKIWSAHAGDDQVADGDPGSPSAAGSARSPRPLKEKRQFLSLGLFAIILSLVGSIAIWATKDDKDSTDKHVSGQEAWDVTAMLLATIMMFVTLVTEVRLYAVVGIGMAYSVMNRTLGAKQASGSNSHLGFGTCPPEWSEQTGINEHTASGIRAGYIMLFIGLGLSLISLFDTSRMLEQLGDLNGPVDQMMANERRASAVIGIVVILCVTYLWSGERFYGQLGWTALIYMLSTVTGPQGRDMFREGLNFVYFAALLQIPMITPFTTCEDSGSANKLVLLLCLMALVALVFQHVTRRGFTANTAASRRVTRQDHAYERVGGDDDIRHRGVADAAVVE
eukprot:TRINITY_DN47224_c0_g1_i1.p1 TRINITY_DN47224_c0_g1~~TRINITY_DN47224_c0_g1_i1.p1  ORF type:complete len:701 (+),score=226.03 TRINITY_DN47224_c0_g1_i1:115-2103(+)